jgi:tight adherence protein B
MVAGSLSSGLSLSRALDSVVRHGLQPAATEFNRAITETRLGADLEDALDGVADRMDSEDMRWTVMAINIQRAVGGNLVEVLHNVVATMRERGYLRRHVKALTAEGRMSAYILIALPILIAAWLFYSSPDYMSPLYTNPIGLLMLVGAAGLIVGGALWMRTLIRPEV